MAKKKSGKPETKSDFLRRALGRNPDLDHREINRRWARAGHPGEISAALFYQVRAKLGIKSQWGWFPAEPKPTRPTRTAPGTDVYRLKITLLGSRPSIWRRIVVGDCTLDELHGYIQSAMGWTNSHLHQFRVGESYFGDPLMLQETFDEEDFGDSTATRLSEIVPRGDQKFRFRYEYDFGDDWRHEILLEGRDKPEPGQTYPVCLAGARACPPEDVGGVWGYADFVAAMADPGSEEHESLREWYGGDFDPDGFSPEKATRAMRGNRRRS